MKIRSKALWHYLQDCGALTQGDEAIARAKREYRKQYKRNHKRNNKKHELRPLFTKPEYTTLCARAQLYGLRPTMYIKHLVSQALESKEIIPYKEDLLSALQQVSLALNISTCATTTKLLSEAEALLLKYLTHDRQNTSAP